MPSNTNLVCLFLVTCSVSLAGCGGDVARPTLPAPEYERPIVTPWPNNAEGGRKDAPHAHATVPVEDAGGGSENSD